MGYFHTGFSDFDKKLGGGLEEGSVAMIYGPSGKSWFLESLLINNACYGIESVYMTFNTPVSEKKKKIAETIEKNIKYKHGKREYVGFSQNILKEKTKPISEKIRVIDAGMIKNENKLVYDYVEKNKIIAIDDSEGFIRESKKASENIEDVMESFQSICSQTGGLGIFISRKSLIQTNVNISSFADYLIKVNMIDEDKLILRVMQESKKIKLDMKSYKIF